MRYIPNGRCRPLNTDDCYVAERICSRKLVLIPQLPVRKQATPAPTVSAPIIRRAPGAELPKRGSEVDLPDLGTGVVDTLNDLVSEPIAEADLLTSSLDNSGLSAEALLEFAVVPEKGSLSEEQMWGFSDSDPLGMNSSFHAPSVLKADGQVDDGVTCFTLFRG